ncbi:MAG: 4Fe-4S dicluster domain-containing protein [Planctomycetes bacterium]|nr:4Fe-4S dicluster domain-containing protein [Planctomycetota bacterium]
MRITTVRVVVQTVTFGLFLAFVSLTTFADLERLPRLRHWVSKLLEIDPLISITTALTTHTVYRGLLWSLIILVPTLFLGRFFCGWICPYGTLHHFIGWLFCGRQQRCTAANSYRPSQHIKYYVLVAMLMAAAFGVLQIGLLDPLCLLHRSLTAAAIPSLEYVAPRLFGDHRVHQGGWLIGLLLFGLLALNLVQPRFFCRVLCPLGALLGLLSRWAWWRIERDPSRCRGCDRCRLHCEAACEPQAQLRQAECFVCFNCIEDCPEDALGWARFPPKEHEVAGPDLARRQVVLAAVAGALVPPLVRTSGRSTRDFSSKCIRPPGTMEELEFLERCVKCGQCVRVCPTNVLQPDWFEGGVEGLWSPVLNFRLGYCQYHCTVCGQVCPTGAIRRITLAEKLGRGPFAESGPLSIGTAHIDVGRCLPHSHDTPCVVCEEVCPTSPKAISAECVVRRMPDGREVELRRPRVDIALCIGCGMCEHQCPVVGDQRAIRVTAEGESRSRRHPARDRNRSLRPT